MSTIVRRLERDHGNFSRVAELLARQLTRIRDDASPDLHLLLEAVDYLGEYAHRYHHRVEDTAVERLTERSGQPPSAELVRLSRRRTELISRTQELRTLVERALADVAVARADFARQLDAYVGALQQHMREKEAVLFPVLVRELDEEDWVEVERRVPPVDDPLFGGSSERHYAALHDRLVSPE